MIFRIKFLTPILILPCLTTSTIAQKLKKADKTTLANLQSHVHYLADPKWAGRKTGTPGEKAASDYISIALGQAGVQPKGDNNGWLQTFEIDQGREVSSDAYFIANDKPFQLDKEYFPLPFSATTPVTGSPAIALQESGEPWFFDLKELVEANAGNPKFDLAGAIRMKVAACTKKGATALILYNSSRTADNLAYNPGEKPAPEAIPVVYITREAKRKYLRDESASVDLRIKIGFSEKRRTGHNVIGFLNNNAATTVVIGAHYDHADTTNGNGANDNASGVAGMIELARMLAVSRLKSNNYLFVAFSGEEQGRYGSRYLVEHSPVEVRKLNYMVNLDMIGRLNDSSHVLTLGGFGSSPSWGDLCNGIKAKKDFSLRLERTGDLSGDHNWFYQKDVPVLFLATGDHPNAVAGGDDPDKINYTGELEVIKFVYDIVEAANTRGRFAFTKAKG
jgi:aminopeptidase YwaD